MNVLLAFLLLLVAPAHADWKDNAMTPIECRTIGNTFVCDLLDPSSKPVYGLTPCKCDQATPCRPICGTPAQDPNSCLCLERIR